MTILDKTVIELINAHIPREYEASAFYMACQLWCDTNGYDGGRDYFEKQTAEELTHRNKFLQYLTDLDAVTCVPAIGAPTCDFKTLKDTFTASLKLELKVTNYIKEMYGAALKAGDYVTCEFLNWFLAEQKDSVTDLNNIMRWFQAFPAEILLIDEKIAEMVK